jgi:uncharacterized protein YbcI
MTDPAGLEQREIEEAISRELLKVHTQSYGVGAHSVRTHITGDLVVTVMDVELSQAEHTLIKAGRAESVRQLRQTFQETIEPVFRAVVERATGRRVTAFLSDLHIEPLFAVEIFRLA